MSNRRMILSEEGKQILDLVIDTLEVERPMAVKIALAKGISSAGTAQEEFSLGKNKWIIPDNIIKDKEFLLFKHLIIHEVNKPLNEEEIHKHMILYIEKGLRRLKQSIEDKTSMEDIRLSIL